MSVLTDLVGHLKAGAVGALVGGPGPAAAIFPFGPPQGHAGAYVTYQQISGPPVRHLRARSALAEVLVQIDVWGPDRGEVEAIADAVEAALEPGDVPFAGQMGSTWVRDAHVQDRSELPGSEVLDGSETVIYRERIDAVIFSSR
jgi:hypothetical protein